MEELRIEESSGRAPGREEGGRARSRRPAVLAFGLLLGALAVAALQWQTARFLGSEFAAALQHGLSVEARAPAR